MAVSLSTGPKKALMDIWWNLHIAMRESRNHKLPDRLYEISFQL